MLSMEDITAIVCSNQRVYSTLLVPVSCKVPSAVVLHWLQIPGVVLGVGFSIANTFGPKRWGLS
jgi:hypothetical protein